ncbi:hypothetical protein MRX96_031875 [Rhipicephalus microplus]
MDKKSDDKQTQKPRAPGKKKSEDDGGAKSPENTALPKPSVEVAQNASPAKVQRRSQDPSRLPGALLHKSPRKHLQSSVGRCEP